MNNYAEEIPEAMEVDSQQEELKNEERIATLEAELKQEKQNARSTKSAHHGKIRRGKIHI